MIQTHRQSSYFAAIKGIAATVILVTSLSAQAQNAPAEQTSAQLTRQASSGNTGTVRLSKNTFRTETVQVPYTERVPYQETETYTEQVPYTVQVPYTDYETDYRDEYQCENVTRYRDEYRCENVTRYRDEYRCENVTRYRQECRNEQECHLVPGDSGQCRTVEECGTNAQGQPICKTRTVCDGGSGPRQVCENRQRCENVPYTDRECRTERVPYYDQECRNISVPYTDRECRNVRVPYQREVTKYRDETRYREETRTRTVTKYRDEQRCCRSEQREVFDRQLQFNVQIAFPQNAVLAAGEVERLIVRLNSAQPASVSVDSSQAIYNYTVLNQSASGEVVNVTLGLLPKYDLANAGEASIRSLRAKFSLDTRKFSVVVEDTIANSSVPGRLNTMSSIAIQDLASGAIIEEQAVSNLANGARGIVVQANLEQQSKFRMILKVQRSGALVAGGQIQFTKSAVYDRKSVQSEDIARLSDASAVKLAAANTSGMSSTMSLVDSTEDFADLKTVYSVTIYELVGDDRTTLTTVDLSREQLRAAGETLQLSQLLGSKASAALRKGKQLRLHVAITRTGEAGSLVSQPIKLVAKANITIK